MAERVRIRSVRDRRTIASGAPARAGPAPAPASPSSGVTRAANSLLPMITRGSTGVPSRPASCGWASRPSVDARTSPSMAKAMSAPVSALNDAARASSSR